MISHAGILFEAAVFHQIIAVEIMQVASIGGQDQNLPLLCFQEGLNRSDYLGHRGSHGSGTGNIYFSLSLKSRKFILNIIKHLIWDRVD